MIRQWKYRSARISCLLQVFQERCLKEAVRWQWKPQSEKWSYIKMYSDLIQNIPCQILDNFNSAWKSSLFIKLDFHWASELRVWTHMEFHSFFEFKLELGYEFTKVWSECFEYFKFYRVQVCLNHKPSSWSLIEFEIWVLKLVEFLSFE